MLCGEPSKAGCLDLFILLIQLDIHFCLRELLSQLLLGIDLLCSLFSLGKEPVFLEF